MISEAIIRTGERLALVEANPYLLELDQLQVFSDVLPGLALVDAIRLADTLLEWRQEYPTAMYLLTRAMAATPTAGDFAEAFARRLSAWEDDPEPADAVFAAGFDTFKSPVRDWLLEREGMRDRLGDKVLPEHPRWRLDERPLPSVPDPLPDVATVAGVQARLLLHEINCGPVTGFWNPRSQVALYRLQYECDHPSPGELDADTMEWLRSVED